MSKPAGNRGSLVRSRPTDSLESLLVRCHRDELLDLAKKVNVRSAGVGLGDLAANVANRIRADGSHGIGNFFRRGRGRPYSEILADAVSSRGLPVGFPEENEITLIRWHFADQWSRISPEERERRWTALGLHGPAPTSGAEALFGAEKELGKASPYLLAEVGRGVAQVASAAAVAVAAGILLRPLFVLGLPIVIWWMLRPNPKKLVELLVEVARLRQVVRHRVTIGVVGSPSTGKDAAIRALFGVDTGNISPIAGSTKEVTIQRVPGSTALFLVNTPGLGDVVERVTEEARQVIDHIDVYLYLVNAEGGVQAREQADWKRVRSSAKPALAIVNKVDVLRPRDKDKYLADAQAKLGVSNDNFLAVAFNPLPQLSPGPIGVDSVRAWLARTLEGLGKDPAELPVVDVPKEPAVEPVPDPVPAVDGEKE